MYIIPYTTEYKENKKYKNFTEIESNIKKILLEN